VFIFHSNASFFFLLTIILCIYDTNGVDGWYMWHDSVLGQNQPDDRCFILFFKSLRFYFDKDKKKYKPFKHIDHFLTFVGCEKRINQATNSVVIRISIQLERRHTHSDTVLYRRTRLKSIESVGVLVYTCHFSVLTFNDR
jgi:hypothetical protein